MDKKDDTYFTRLGDGSATWMSKAEIREDVLAGMEDAVDRGKATPLTGEDVDKLVDILTMAEKNVGV